MKKITNLSSTFFKIILPFVLLITIVLFQLIEWRLVKNRQTQLEEKMSFELNMISLILAQPLWNLDKETIDSFLLIKIQDPDIVGIYIFDEFDRQFDSIGLNQPASIQAILENCGNISPNELIKRSIFTFSLFRKDKYPKLLCRGKSIWFLPDDRMKTIGTIVVILSDQNSREEINNILMQIFFICLTILVFITLSILYSYKQSVGIPLYNLKQKIHEAYMEQSGRDLGDSDYKNEIIYIQNAFSTIWERQKSLEHDLRLSWEEFRDAITQSPIPIMIFDENGSTVLLNRLFTFVFGYTVKDIKSEKDWWTLAFPDENYREEIRLQWQNQLDSIQNVGHSGPVCSAILFDKEGKRHFIEFKISKTKDNTVIAVHDVTDRILVEQEKSQLESQLTHKNKLDAIGQLAGGVAHDFNNILTGILGASHLLEISEHIQDKESQKYVKMIRKSSERAAELVDNLLAFSRKKSNIEEYFVLNKVIDDAYELLLNTINKEVEINVKTEEDHCTLYGNSSNLINVLLNLGINASQAMPDGGDLEISTKIKYIDDHYASHSAFDLKTGEFCEITVSDTGTGIPEEILDKIFDPFFTTKEGSEGTGLGLSTVYGIIQDFNGEITVKSEEGSGTAFDILLPLAHIESSQSQDDHNIGSAEHSGVVLFVDDEEMNRILGQDILTRMGYEVLLASNGYECLELFQENQDKINFIILDMIMPKMSGYKTYMKLKTIDPSCKIIISSGFSDSHDIDALEKSGQSWFLNKPYSITDLEKIIQKVKQG